jgi:hypothetical protein
MSFTDKQREALIKERGEPKLRLEFDVFDENKVSMWTHFNHGDNFQNVRVNLIAIRDHLNEFLRDENMCPFHKPEIKNR